MAVERNEDEYNAAYLWFFNDSGLVDDYRINRVSDAATRDGVPMTKSFWEAIVRAVLVMDGR